MKNVLILIFSFAFVSANCQITRMTPGDNLPTVLGKTNKVIDYEIRKNGTKIFVIDFGLVADGVTDDGPAVQAAFDYAPAGSIIEFPYGASIAMITPAYTEKKFTVLCNYSNFILSSNKYAFYFNVKDECVFRDAVFVGSGRSVSTKTDQVGVLFNGGVRHQIQNLRFNEVSGCGLLMVNNYGESTSLQQQGSNINNLTLFKCNIGLAMMARSEYNIITNVTGFENATTIDDWSGNNNLTGFSFQGGTGYGYRFRAGNNVGHGSISNGNMNHFTTAYGIHANGNGTGVLVTGVNFYQTNNRFENGTKAVVFQNCAFDGSAAAGAVQFDGATSVHNTLNDCFFTIAATDPKTKITATNSAKFSVVNMRRVDGSIFNFGNYTTSLLAAKTSNYTVTSGDAVWTTKVDATSAAVTLSLPAAADMEGQRFSFMKIDASANAMNIDPNASETINGSSSTLAITTQWEVVILEGYAGNWIRIQ